MSLSIQTDSIKILEFISWLKNRLKIKYNETDDNIFTQLDAITEYCDTSKNIIDSNNSVDELCKRIFFGFDVIKDESSMFDVGYSEKERNEIRVLVNKIIKEHNNLI